MEELNLTKQEQDLYNVCYGNCKDCCSSGNCDLEKKLKQKNK